MLEIIAGGEGGRGPGGGDPLGPRVIAQASKEAFKQKRDENDKHVKVMFFDGGKDLIKLSAV